MVYRRASLIIFLFCLSQATAFVPTIPQTRRLPLVRYQGHARSRHNLSRHERFMTPTPELAPAEEEVKAKDPDKTGILPVVYTAVGVASTLAWIAMSVVTLSYHPDPKFANCGLRHNILTMGQAFAFPLPMLWATFAALRGASIVGWKRLSSATYRRLNLSLACASLWLGASALVPTAFAFGYDLLPGWLKIGAVTTYFLTASVAIATWAKTVYRFRYTDGGFGSYLSRIVLGVTGSLRCLISSSTTTDDPDKDATGASLYALGSLGLYWFGLQSVLSPYPLATIPTILGKRLSRPAAAFCWLGGGAAYCLKDAAERDRLGASTFKKLKKGIVIGCGLHLLLVASKLIGVDGGGLLLEGNGLWEVYPAMMAVPLALGASLAVHALLFMAAMIPPQPSMR